MHILVESASPVDPALRDLREKALALQNLLIGLNVMCKVVRSEKDLWRAARQTLKGLGVYGR